MADIKVVNVEQLNADITNIANAIREKAGISDELAFPNGLIEAIANMETGMNTPYLLAWDAGVASFAGVEADYTVEHNLGVVPDFYVFTMLNHFDDIMDGSYEKYVLHTYFRATDYNRVYQQYGVTYDSAYYTYGSYFQQESNKITYATDQYITYRKGWPPNYPTGQYLWFCGKLAREW